MRRTPLLTVSTLGVVAWVASCAVTEPPTTPPPDRFYFPTGIAHLDLAGTEEGVLVVSNSNLDKHYGVGTLSVLELDKMAERLPVFGASGDGGGVPQRTELPAMATALVPSMSGELALYSPSANRWRAVVPTRSEGMWLTLVDLDIADGSVTPSCYSPDGGQGLDCSTTGVSLSPTAFERSPEGVPRAPSPYGVAVKPRMCPASCVAAQDCGCECGADLRCRSDGPKGKELAADIYIAHIAQADSPLMSGLNYRGYAVIVDATRPEVSRASFINLDAGATNSVAVGQRWGYFGGRGLNPVGNLVRLVNAENGGTIVDPKLQNLLQVFETRGLALSSDERRLYVVGREPDSLIVVGITDPESEAPSLSVLRHVPLPADPNSLRIIPRVGQSDLVAIVCPAARALVFYDDEVGNVVAQVPGIGVQPFDLAVDHRGTGARIFISVFGDGRVAVVDVPSLAQPQSARLVAHIGKQQLCIVAGTKAPSCDGGMQ